MNKNNFENEMNLWIEKFNVDVASLSVSGVLRKNYDLIDKKLFSFLDIYKVDKYEVLSSILLNMGVASANRNNVANAISRIRKEKGIDLKAKARIPQNQVITTAPKVNDNAIKEVSAPSVVVDTVKTSNKALETIKNDVVMVEAQSGVDISPEVINSIKISIDETDIDMNIELARLVQEFDSRKEKGFTFSEMDRQLLIYFTNYAFKLNKNLTELSLAIEDYHTTLKEVLKYYKFKCNQLQIDLKLYGKSKN